MKKLLGFFLALFVSASLATPVWYQGTSPGSTPKVVSGDPFSLLAADVKLGVGDTTYSQVFDMYKLPIVVLDSLGILGRLDTAMTVGSVIVSCYDVADSAAVTDSVIVTTTVQESQFAADGVNPNVPFSAAWDSSGVVTLAKPSDTQTLVNGLSRPLLKTREHRFLRFRLINLSATTGAAVKNVPRCRVIWQARARLR